MNAELLEQEQEDVMLTTHDNPYNPREDYDKWRRWDVDNGYHTEEVLARYLDIPVNVDVDDEEKINELRQQAILTLVEHDVTGNLKLV